MTLWDAYVLANRRRCSLRVRLADGETGELTGQIVRVGTRRVDGRVIVQPERTFSEQVCAERLFVAPAKAKEILVERAR